MKKDGGHIIKYPFADCDRHALDGKFIHVPDEYKNVWKLWGFEHESINVNYEKFKATSCNLTQKYVPW